MPCPTFNSAEGEIRIHAGRAVVVVDVDQVIGTSVEGKTESLVRLIA